MHDEIAQPKCFFATQFVHEGGNRLVIKHIIRRGEVDEIGVVRGSEPQSRACEALRKASISLAVSGFAFHWLAFLVRN